MNTFLLERRRILIAAATVTSLNTRSINQPQHENSEDEEDND